MGLTAGQSLTHYEILGPLGAGAMGEVYRARDTRLEREVALKVLPEELAGDEERLRRFEREAKTLASLNHPNVAQVFGIDQVDDTCFIAMELVPGEDLAERLERGPLPLDEAIDVCRQIAEGLEAAHEAGVIHRDMKPANVVITPEGRVKVLDFGLAKPAGTGGRGSSTTDSVLTTEAGRPAPTLAVIALVAGVAATLGWTRWGADGTTTPALSRPYPITFGFEWEGTPAWSPSSERMAFTRMEEGSLDIYVKSVVGEKADRLVSGPGDEYSPHWSPDGRFVAYLSSGSPGAPLCLVRVDGGGEPRELVDTNVPRLAINVLARCLGDRPWLDEHTLIVSRALPTTQVAIFRVDVESGAVEQISSPPVGADDLCASLSFDRQRIVFERRADGNGELWTMDPDGGGAALLLGDGLDNKSPAWRPDGERVLYRSYAGESFENVWELELATRELQRVTNLTKNIWSFSVSADDRIAIAPSWHDTFLWSVDVTTGERAELTTHIGDNFGGRYSPDDRYVAYHSNRLGDTDVWRLDLETGAETNLTSHPGLDVFPDWSPDGSQLVFVSNREGTYDLFVMDADGSNKRRIVSETVVRGTNALNSGLIARWSPDGLRIAYLRADEDGTSVWTVGPDGADNRLLLEDVLHFDWLGDRRAVFSRQDQHGRDLVLYVTDLDSGRTSALYEGPHMEIDAAPDGSSVAFCSGIGHLGMKPYVLRLREPNEAGGLPEAVGDPEPLYPLELSWHVHMGGWSSNSERLLFTWDRDYCDVYVLEEGK